MNKSLTIIKGCSGSGKSTRVALFIMFLRDYCGAEVIEFQFENFLGKSKSIGLLFKRLDILFIGKYSKDGRWQGIDSMTGHFGSSSNIEKFYIDFISKYHIIVDGAGTTESFRFRPLELMKNVKPTKLFIQYYSFALDKKHEYFARIKGRSGKNPTSDAMWKKNTLFLNAYKKSKIESIGFKNCIVYDGNFDDNIYDFGVKWLEINGIKSYTKEFIEYAKIHS